MEIRRLAMFALVAGSAAALAHEVKLDSSPDRVPTPLKVDMPRVGTLAPRGTREERGQPWMLGCETLDRDFADFDQYKEFLEPLGIKRIRLQCGWAKCEKEKGRYDFTWLDHCVDYAAARGIRCVLETDYGNPLYGNGYRFHLWQEKHWAAWEAWVRALATHFKGRVEDFLMWNEPDCGKSQPPPEAIANQNVRTARVIKEIIPAARIGAFSYSSGKVEKFERSLVALGADAKLFTWVVYHGYRPNPDSGQGLPEAWAPIIARHAPHLKLFQGEQGSPSKRLTGYALKDHDWTEWSQAKWNLRRFVGDIGHGAESSVFTIADICYRDKGVHNAKGLLATDLDMKVVGVKVSYYAVQNMVSVFDDSLEWLPNPPFTSAATNLSVYAWRRKADGAPLVAFWDNQDGRGKRAKGGKMYPTESFETRPVTLVYAGMPPKEPVWVDLMSGRVYAIPAAKIKVTCDSVTFADMPAYDSPCVLTERAVLKLQ